MLAGSHKTFAVLCKTCGAVLASCCRQSWRLLLRHTSLSDITALTETLSYVIAFLKIVDKREIRYVMETFPEHASDNALDWWSADTELNVLPSTWQLQRKWLIAACRATVLNETVYQRVVSLNFTSGIVQSVQHAQRVRPSSVSAAGQQHVSASMASSQHNSFSHSSSSKGKLIYSSRNALNKVLCGT